VRRECTALLFALADLAHPALARTYLNCTTKEVAIVSGSSEDGSSNKEKDMGFWVDDLAKTVTFADGAALTVTRLDEARGVAAPTRDDWALLNPLDRKTEPCGAAVGTSTVTGVPFTPKSGA
jgi:hypothetical protein